MCVYIYGYVDIEYILFSKLSENRKIYDTHVNTHTHTFLFSNSTFSSRLLIKSDQKWAPRNTNGQYDKIVFRNYFR